MPSEAFNALKDEGRMKETRVKVPRLSSSLYPYTKRKPKRRHTLHRTTWDNRFVLGCPDGGAAFWSISEESILFSHSAGTQSCHCPILRFLRITTVQPLFLEGWYMLTLINEVWEDTGALSTYQDNRELDGWWREARSWCLSPSTENLWETSRTIKSSAVRPMFVSSITDLGPGETSISPGNGFSTDASRTKSPCGDTISTVKVQLGKDGKAFNIYQGPHW